MGVETVKQQTVRIPGTPEWLEAWRGKGVNHSAMLKYRTLVDSLTKTMKKSMVKHFLKLTEWDQEDEAKVAAARVININKQGVDIMKKIVKKEEEGRKEVEEKEVEEEEEVGAIVLTELESRITDIEDDVQKIFNILQKLTKEGKSKSGKEAKAPKETKAHKETEAPDKEIKKLLKELQEAKDNDEKKVAFKIRVKLRKAGYSLRAPK